MRCPACGQLLADGVQECPSCGAKIEGQDISGGSAQNRPNDGYDYNGYNGGGGNAGHDGYNNGNYGSNGYINDGYNSGNYSSNGYNNADYNNGGHSYTSYNQPYNHQPDMPMKWYKFLIYVSLILSGISNIYSGICSIIGMSYGDAETAAQIYEMYGGLRIVDIFYGLLMIAFGVYAFFVRQQLAHYKKGAPRHVLILYLAGALSVILYLVCASLATGVNLMNLGFISNLLVSVFMVIANKIYFDKRAHLFIN